MPDFLRLDLLQLNWLTVLCSTDVCLTNSTHFEGQRYSGLTLQPSEALKSMRHADELVLRAGHCGDCPYRCLKRWIDNLPVSNSQVPKTLCQRHIKPGRLRIWVGTLQRVLGVEVLQARERQHEPSLQAIRIWHAGATRLLWHVTVRDIETGMLLDQALHARWLMLDTRSSWQLQASHSA